MAEFAWSRIEPEPGVFCFEWLDEAVSVMYRHGISTILGTPTAAPPAWLTEKYPDILPVDSHGMVKGFGGRHHDCQSSQDYRNAVGDLVTAMARHYRDHPAIAGWQIDNESNKKKKFEQFFIMTYPKVKAFAWKLISHLKILTPA